MADSSAGGRQGRGKKRDRAISHLTEEQLQHKRSVDRKAQRALRQRTKEGICRLEQQIAILQKSADEREARYQHELSALRGTNDALLQCLQNISEMASSSSRSMADAINTHESSNNRVPAEIHRFIDSARSSSPRDHLHDHTTVDAAHIASSSSSKNAVVTPLSAIATTQPETERLPEVPHVATPLEHQMSALPHSDQVSQQHGPGNDHHENLISHQGDCNGASRRVSPTMLERARTAGSILSTTCPLSSTSPEATSSPYSDYRGPHTIHNEYSSNHVLSPLVPNPTPSVEAAYVPRSSTPHLHSVFTVLPSHVPPTCPLDEILHTFLNSRREMIAQGLAIDTIAGPQKPTVKALLNSSLTSTVPPLCAVMSEVLSTFAHVDQPEKLAFFYLMFKTMRWQISPSKESYIAMPTWLRPTVTQITVQHAAWIDNIPWPGVRDILIENPDDHPFEVFSQYYSQNVSIGWNFDSLDAVTDVDNEVVLHSIFEKHICNLKNWTVASAFQQRFPYMTASIFSRD